MQVALLLGCEPQEVVFTAGGTEANNLAIHGVLACAAERRVVTTSIEHPAIAVPCTSLARQNCEVVRVEVDHTGRVDPVAARSALRSVTALVSVMHANNETGVVQPVREIASMARSVGAMVHTDAAQTVGKIPTLVDELDVDLLSLAAHKFYGPKGVGALYVRRGTNLIPLTRGAGQERGLRPGTENVAGIVGLGVACEVARSGLAESAARLELLRDSLWEMLAGSVPGLMLNGHVECRLPNTLNVRFPGVSGRALLQVTPEVAASTGAACHDGVEAPSPVLLAMGVPRQEALGSVRLTVGRTTTKADVDRAATALARSWKRLAG